MAEVRSKGDPRITWYCKVCTGKFQGTIENHIIKVHPDQETNILYWIRCLSCVYKSTNLNKYRKHLAQKHQINDLKPWRIVLGVSLFKPPNALNDSSLPNGPNPQVSVSGGGSAQPRGLLSGTSQGKNKDKDHGHARDDPMPKGTSQAPQTGAKVQSTKQAVGIGSAQDNSRGEQDHSKAAAKGKAPAQQPAKQDGGIGGLLRKGSMKDHKKH